MVARVSRFRDAGPLPRQLLLRRLKAPTVGALPPTYMDPPRLQDT